jgi:hypothetical protein
MSKGDPGCTIATFMASLPKSNPITFPSVSRIKKDATTKSRMVNMIPLLARYLAVLVCCLQMLREVDSTLLHRKVFYSSRYSLMYYSKLLIRMINLCGWNFSKMPFWHYFRSLNSNTRPLSNRLVYLVGVFRNYGFFTWPGGPIFYIFGAPAGRGPGTRTGTVFFHRFQKLQMRISNVTKFTLQNLNRPPDPYLQI